MKKLLMIVTALLLIAASFSACAKPADTAQPGESAAPAGEADPAVAGVYLIDSISGMPVKEYLLDRTKEGGAELEELITGSLGEGEELDYSRLMILELNEDGSGSLKNSLTGESVGFTWTRDRNEVIMRASESDSEMRAGISGGTITVTLKNDLGLDELFVFKRSAE